MQNINFNASEVAALINKNPYKSQEEALHDLLCRVKKQKNTSFGVEWRFQKRTP